MGNKSGVGRILIPPASASFRGHPITQASPIPNFSSQTALVVFWTEDGAGITRKTERKRPSGRNKGGSGHILLQPDSAAGGLRRYLYRRIYPAGGFGYFFRKGGRGVGGNEENRGN